MLILFAARDMALGRQHRGRVRVRQRDLRGRGRVSRVL
jgi:hypothetical protein